MDVEKFDHYPTLTELGFTNGGVPGIEYAFLTSEDRRKAQADGFGAVLGGTGTFFTVTGPKGEVDLEVWGRGRPIHGLDTNQIQPAIFVSNKAEQATGLSRVQVVDDSNDVKGNPRGTKTEEATSAAT